MSEEKKELSAQQPTTGNKQELKRYTSPLEEMERMFDDLVQRRLFAPSWFPRLKLPEFGDVSATVDMFEEGNDLVIKAEIPGIKKEDISIDFSGDMLTISGEKKSEERTERKDFYRLERSFGSFSRKLRLPVEIQVDRTHATFKDGVLEIRMPKSEKARQETHKIQIK